jgi:hypothetical protein
MSRMVPDRYSPPPRRDRDYDGPCDRKFVSQLLAEKRQLERDLSERDRQVVSLEAEVQRLNRACCPGNCASRTPSLTRREKIAAATCHAQLPDTEKRVTC